MNRDNIVSLPTRLSADEQSRQRQIVMLAEQLIRAADADQPYGDVLAALGRVVRRQNTPGGEPA